MYVRAESKPVGFEWTEQRGAAEMCLRSCQGLVMHCLGAEGDTDTLDGYVFMYKYVFLLYTSGA